MNIIRGEIVLSQAERDAALDALQGAILGTIGEGKLHAETVVNACDALAGTIGEAHAALLESAGVPAEKARGYIREAKLLLRKEHLLRRLNAELGDGWSKAKVFLAEGEQLSVREAIMPLGVLLHIAAGNQFGLAFYSVIEGLLTGNINLVKLPGGDDGLSAFIFLELFKIEPRLKDYVYLFDYTSKDAGAMQKLIRLSDAVVIWGGDQTVREIRRMADPDTRLIEWGHKLSFAYVTRGGMQEHLLEGLAQNIVETNQLLCSSCQGVYLDTDSMDEMYGFCGLFLPILERCQRALGGEPPLEIQAQIGLSVYTERLKGGPCRAFRGERTSLFAYEDSALTPSLLYGNCWVKRLPREKLIPALKPHKGHLQTAGLLCAAEEEDALTALLWKAGLVRVTRGINMSWPYHGAAHDGEYALRRYTRIVSQELPK